MTLCAGTILVWLGSDSFGPDTIEAVLIGNPMAAALSIMEIGGFQHYDLIPDNWWIVGTAIAVLHCECGSFERVSS